MLKWVLVAGAVLAMPTMASAQDAEAGKKVFAQQCAACHKVGPGAKNTVGPELNGLSERKSGSLEGYNFSPALKTAAIEWTTENLDEWLADPKKKIPGNRMPFPGVKDELKRADLVAYLESLNADGRSK